MSVELVEGGKWLRYQVTAASPRYIRAERSVNGASAVLGELFITNNSFGWGVPDGNGGAFASQVKSPATDQINFDGSYGTGTSELALDSGPPAKVKFRSGSGESYAVRGDLREAKKPTNVQTSNKENGTAITADFEQKNFLQQRVNIYVWRDETDTGWQQPGLSGNKWQLINQGPAQSFVDTGAQDGVEHVYALQNEVRDIDATWKFTALSDKVKHTFDNSAEVSTPTTTPNGLNIGAGFTCDLEATWSNTNSTALIDLQLERSPDASSWSIVTDSDGFTYIFEEDSGSTSTDFTFDDGSCYNAASDTYYRVKARYRNSAGTGPWSAYSDAYYKTGGIGIE